MNSALVAAWAKGRKAARMGKPRTANPYVDHRNARGHVTWSRAFRKEWFEGYDAEVSKRDIA